MEIEFHMANDFIHVSCIKTPNKFKGWAFGLAVKMAIRTPASHIRKPGFDPLLQLLFQFPAKTLWEAVGNGSSDCDPAIQIGDLHRVLGSWLQCLSLYQNANQQAARTQSGKSFQHTMYGTVCWLSR